MRPSIKKEWPPCGRYPESAAGLPNIVYDDYVEDLLSREEKEQFEDHYESCRYCTARLKEAYFRDEKLAKSYLLSNAGQSRSLAETRRYLHEQFKTARRTQRESPPLAIAAAGKRQSSPGTGVGIAYGVGVERGSRMGALIECSAWIDSDILENGTLELRGIEVESVRKDDVEISISSPLELLTEQLEELLESHPVLKGFELWRRNITVDISQEGESGYIIEAHSLALAVLIAILSAYTGIEPGRRYAFSAGIRRNGVLKSVGCIREKCELVNREGISTLIVPEGNRTECEAIYYESGGAVEILHFTHLDETLDHLGFLNNAPLPGPAVADEDAWAERPVVVPPPRSLYCLPASVEGWRFLVELGKSKGFQEGVIIELCEFAEDLCQIRQEMKPISTAFIIGDTEKITHLLPPSPLKMVGNGDFNAMRKILIRLSSVVNGTTMGFLVGQNGNIHSIRKMSIDISGDFPTNRLLDGVNRRYAAISKITDAMIFYISSISNHVAVFNGGEMVGRYKDGDWQPTDYLGLEKILNEKADEKGIVHYVIEKVGRVAIRMADLHEGGIFIVFDKGNAIKECYNDSLKTLSVEIAVDSIRDISDDDLLNFAKEDGAVLIDNKGNLHAIMAFLKLQHGEQLNHDPGIGTRHFSAQVLSKNLNCLGIVISQDGAITLYYNGENIFKI